MIDFIDFDTYIIIMAIAGLFVGVLYELIAAYFKRKGEKKDTLTENL